MRIRTILNRCVLPALGACLAVVPVGAQEHPARRVASVVSVAVEEYAKAVDGQGRLISAQEYQEASDFLTDARSAADRLPGAQAVAARALLDSIAAAVRAKRPPVVLDSLEARFAVLLGNEGKLELPRGALDLVAGRQLFQSTCASCHGVSGQGGMTIAGSTTPRPPAIGTAAVMHEVTPGLMYRVISVGITGTPMPGFANTLTPEQRWNVVGYVNSLRSICHAIVPISGGSLVSARASVPSPAPATPWHEAQPRMYSPSPSSSRACVLRSEFT